MNDKEEMVYIVRMRKCNCIVGATLDNPERHPDAITRFLNDAATDVIETYIEHTTAAFLRKVGRLQFCKICKPEETG